MGPKAFLKGIPKESAKLTQKIYAVVPWWKSNSLVESKQTTQLFDGITLKSVIIVDEE